MKKFVFGGTDFALSLQKIFARKGQDFNPTGAGI